MSQSGIPSLHPIWVHPIWYRHWLELRYRLIAAGVVGLLFSLFYPASIAGSLDWMRRTGHLVDEVRGAQQLLGSMDPERVVVWGLFAQLLAFASVFAAICVSYFGPPPPPLALPVSGFLSDLTGLLVRWSGVVAVTLSMTGLHVLILAVRGNPIPGGKMIATWAVLCALWLPALALQAVFNMNKSSAILFGSFWPIIAIVWGFPFLRGIVFHPDSAWRAALLALTAATVIFAAAQQLARRREM